MAIQENSRIYRGKGHAGEAILEVVSNLPSIEPQHLHDIPTLERVVFYGSSGSGKSTLEGNIRKSPKLNDRISVPNRIVTRAARPDDVDIDHYTEEEFAEMVRNGTLGMNGVKIMEGGREEPYGISRPEPGKLPVFMANNTVALYPERIQPPSFFDGALLVTIYAPDPIRKERILDRSPDMASERPAEFAYRMSAIESADHVRGPAHLVVNNFGLNERHTPTDVVNLLHRLA